MLLPIAVAWPLGASGVKSSDSLVFTAPLRIRYYTRASSFHVEFAWRYESFKTARPDEEFVLEFSPDANFQKIVMREFLIGGNSMSVPVSAPQSLYYRLRDKSGNYSAIKRLEVVSPTAPEILSVDRGSNASVKLQLAPPGVYVKHQIQIATNPEFSNPVFDRHSTVPQVFAELKPGRYFVRARNVIEIDHALSDWGRPRMIAVPPNP